MKHYHQDFPLGKGDVTIVCVYTNALGQATRTALAVDSNVMRTCRIAHLLAIPGNSGVITLDDEPDTLLPALYLAYAGHRGPRIFTAGDYRAMAMFVLNYDSPPSFRSLVKASLRMNVPQLVRNLRDDPTPASMIITIGLAHEERSERLWAALIDAVSHHSSGGWQVIHNPFDMPRCQVQALGFPLWSLLVLVARVGALVVPQWDVQIKYLDDGVVKVVSKDGSVDIVHDVL